MNAHLRLGKVVTSAQALLTCGEFDTDMSHASASRLANTIRKYWAERGYVVAVRTVPISGNHERSVFAVRSDLVNGLPRDFKN